MRLPVHGFVLAGGLSSRMGTDKALLQFGGRSMVEIAVETLRGFCAEVSVAGNREDLERFAPVVRETRIHEGPAAGIEAGLLVAEQAWVMFMPVDVPLVPAALLHAWMGRVVERGVGASVLMVNGSRQPAFCAFRRDRCDVALAAVAGGERRINAVLGAYGHDVWECDVAELAPKASEAELERRFTNVNTPEDLVVAEAFGEEGFVQL